MGMPETGSQEFSHRQCAGKILVAISRQLMIATLGCPLWAFSSCIAGVGMPTNSWTDRAIALRTAVALIGEQENLLWWRSQALSEDGVSLLQHIFPRTANSAAVQLAWRAAQREHDRRLGAIGGYHLYRLPTAIEDVIANRVRGMDQVQLPDHDAAIQKLTEIAGERESDDVAAGGPVNCGKFASTDRALVQMAMHYLSGATEGHSVFPYFVSKCP